MKLTAQILFPCLKKFIKLKLRGGALYISILISIIIGIILSLFILLSYYNQTGITAYQQSIQLQANLNSAFEMAQSDYFDESLNGQWLKNQTNSDSIKINKKMWGAFMLISAHTKNRHESLSQTGIYGTFMSNDTGLVTTDNSRPLGLSGAVIFKANCYLPRAGIKPAYIEGQSYQALSQNTQFIKPAPQLPGSPSVKLVGLIEQQRKLIEVGTDSLVNEIPQRYSRSFKRSTMVLEYTKNELKNVSWKNNIKVMCGDIRLDSSCHFENVLIICNKAHFASGFKGSVHVIARDSIVAGKECLFEYPSSFVLLPGISDEPGLNFVFFDKACRFFGGIVAQSRSNDAKQRKVMVKLNAEGEVNGLIYSSDYLHVEGKIFANAYCNKLLIKTPSAVYENHILGCEIDPKKNSRILAIPLVFGKEKKLFRASSVKE